MVHLGQTFLLFLKIMGVSHPFTSPPQPPPPPRNVRPFKVKSESNEDERNSINENGFRGEKNLVF